MRKGLMALIAVVVVIAAAGVGYELVHSSKKTTNPPTSSTSSTTNTNDSVVITKTSSSLGQYLTEPNGQPLYAYGGDSNDVSNCTGSCLASWPAYQDKGSTSGLPTGVNTIKRADNGETQFTYNGMPLYTFVSDSNGQATGNGVSNFTLAKPSATTSSSSASTSTGSTGSSSTSSGSSW